MEFVKLIDGDHHDQQSPSQFISIDRIKVDQSDDI